MPKWTRDHPQSTPLLSIPQRQPRAIVLSLYLAVFFVFFFLLRSIAFDIHARNLCRCWPWLLSAAGIPVRPSRRPSVAPRAGSNSCDSFLTQFLLRFSAGLLLLRIRLFISHFYERCFSIVPTFFTISCAITFFFADFIPHFGGCQLVLALFCSLIPQSLFYLTSLILLGLAFSLFPSVFHFFSFEFFVLTISPKGVAWFKSDSCACTVFLLRDEQHQCHWPLERFLR